MASQSPTARIVSRTIPSDDLTPILAYRRLVTPDERHAPSFLLESVEVGGVMGRWSYLGASPRAVVVNHVKPASLRLRLLALGRRGSLGPAEPTTGLDEV